MFQAAAHLFPAGLLDWWMTVFSGLASILLAVAWFTVRRLIASLDANTTALAEFGKELGAVREDVARNYLSKKDFYEIHDRRAVPR